MQIFSRFMGLAFLLASLGMFGTAKGQDQPRLLDLEMNNGVYIYESGLYIAPNVVIRISTPDKDTFYLANRTWFSKTKAPNYIGECIYDSLNPGKFSIDSTAMFIGIKKNNDSVSIVWGKMLIKRGQSELINYAVDLSSGDILVIREVYRRVFDCSANIWFFIKQKARPMLKES